MGQGVDHVQGNRFKESQSAIVIFKVALEFAAFAPSRAKVGGKTDHGSERCQSGIDDRERNLWPAERVIGDRAPVATRIEISVLILSAARLASDILIPEEIRMNQYRSLTVNAT